MELGALVDAYWEYYRRTSGGATRPERLGADEFSWAWDEVESLIHDDEIAERQLGLHRVGLLIALAEGAPDQEALAYLGAGPVEELLRDHEPNIGSIDEAARQNERFRYALRCAWFDRDLPAADAERLRRFGASP